MTTPSDNVRKAAEEIRENWTFYNSLLVGHDPYSGNERVQHFLEAIIESHCHVTEMEAVIEKCREALVPFASKDECEIGVIVGTHSDEQCQECNWIVKAREALSSIDALKGDK